MVNNLIKFLLMNDLKIICTTSNSYLHIVPVFCHLFNKFWGGPCEIVGYEEPENLPSNFTFYSMGVQGDKKEFSNDLRKYFQKQEAFFIWCMEDSFLRAPVNQDTLKMLRVLCAHDVGRINLTNEA